MTDRDTRRLTRAKNVVIFGENNEADHAHVPTVKEHLVNISGSITLITGARAGQTPHRITKATLLDSLLHNFKRIAGTARSIELQSRETGFSAPFIQHPYRVEKDITAHADSLLKILEDNEAPVEEGGDTKDQKAAKAALRNRFLALAINPAFVTNLRHDRDGLEQLHKHNRTEVQEGTADTALIDAQLTLINHEIDILQPIMANIYEFQPEKLHAWHRASRVERSPRRTPKPTDTPTPPADA